MRCCVSVCKCCFVHCVMGALVDALNKCTPRTPDRMASTVTSDCNARAHTKSRARFEHKRRSRRARFTFRRVFSFLTVSGRTHSHVDLDKIGTHTHVAKQSNHIQCTILHLSPARTSRPPLVLYRYARKRAAATLRSWHKAHSVSAMLLYTQTHTFTKVTCSVRCTRNCCAVRQLVCTCRKLPISLSRV